MNNYFINVSLAALSNNTIILYIISGVVTASISQYHAKPFEIKNYKKYLEIKCSPLNKSSCTQT